MAHRGDGTGARWTGARSVPATAAMSDIEPSQDCTVPEPKLAKRAGRYLGLLLDHRNGRRVGMATRPAHEPVDELGRRRRSVALMAARICALSVAPPWQRSVAARRPAPTRSASRSWTSVLPAGRPRVGPAAAVAELQRGHEEQHHRQDGAAAFTARPQPGRRPRRWP